MTAEEIATLLERRHVHQFNDRAVRMTRTLTDALGLDDIGVHVVRLEPGAESTQQHYHDADEEFLYVISGRGIAGGWRTDG